MRSLLAAAAARLHLPLVLLLAVPSFAQRALSTDAPTPTVTEPKTAVPPQTQAPVERVPPQTPPASTATAYDPAIFQNRIPADQMAFLKSYAGMPAKDLLRDKNFKKLMKTAMPDCTFHYGRDMSLSDAMSMVLDGSRAPVQLREDRYLLVSGAEGPYLAGRGFLWMDLQDGIALGGFYFHPVNGEPTPAVNIFSRQIDDDALSMGELPPAFFEDTVAWAEANRVPLLTTRYFINAGKKKVLLEHDEDFCSPSFAAVAGPNGPQPGACEDMNAEAADLDLTAAYYVEQTHHVTNATAWMLNPEQTVFIQTRDRTCGGLADPLGCRIRLTREQTRLIVRPRPTMPRRR